MHEEYLESIEFDIIISFLFFGHKHM
jgi:hypothetical protein